MSLPPYITPSGYEADNPVWDAIVGLQPWQFYYNGQTFGLGYNGVQWKELDGFDIENIRTGDSGQPRDQGEFAGYDFLAGRDLTFKFDVQAGGTPGGTLQANMLRLSSAFRPQGNVETPIYFNWPGYYGVMGVLCAMVRPRNRSWKADITYSLGELAQDCQVMVHATDPRFYSFPTNQTVFTDSYTASIPNTGNCDCRPTIVFDGPATNPGITDSYHHIGWIYKLAALGYDGVYPESISADCYFQTVLNYNAPITTGREVEVSCTSGGRHITALAGDGTFTSGDISAAVTDGVVCFDVGTTITAIDAYGAVATISTPTLAASAGEYATVGGLRPASPRPFAYALTSGSQWPTMPAEATQTWTTDAEDAIVYWADAWLL